jgi:hypothetical protein
MRATASPETETRHVNLEMVTKSLEQFHSIAKDIGRKMGWTSCSLQKALQHMMDTYEYGESTPRKPAARAQATRNGKSRK